MPLPAAKAVLAIQFADLLEALEADAGDPRAQPVGGRGDGPLHPRQHEAERRARTPAPDVHRRRSRGAAVRRVLRRPRRGPAAAAGALERDLQARRFGYRYHRAIDLAAQARIWSLREAALGLSMAMKDDAKSLSFVEDTAVAPERLRDYIERFLGIVARHGTTAGVYAHASVGCLHVRPVVNLKTEAGVRTFEAIAYDIADLVLEFGGALSGEHGDGLVRSPFMEKMFGPVLYDAFRQVKRTFDPDGIFNPGKIVDAPPLTANLRYGAGYQTPTPGHLLRLLGVRRHRRRGRDVQRPRRVPQEARRHDVPVVHGDARGEALDARPRQRAAARDGGRLGEAGLGDEGVHEVLDLCLECRACKAECPVGVDVARFKSEFLADYWRATARRCARACSATCTSVARWGSRLAPLSNWMAQSAPGRWLNEAAARHRSPAHAARVGSRTFRRRFESAQRPAVQRGPAATRARRPCCSSTTPSRTTTIPRSASRARACFEAAGFRSSLAPNGCCGRPLISQGLLAEARAAAQPTPTGCIRSPRGRAASCSSSRAACRRCARTLRRCCAARHSGRRAAVAAPVDAVRGTSRAACSIGTRQPSAWPRARRRSSLHGHCHQKAMGLLPPAKALLSRIPGATVVDLDAGCCGMAGSFGYAARTLRRVARDRRAAAAAGGATPRARATVARRRRRRRAGTRLTTSPARVRCIRRSCSRSLRPGDLHEPRRPLASPRSPSRSSSAASRR